MAREFRLPDIGEGLTEAEIVRWLVGVGDVVKADQPIVEVETDKAVVEIPSPFAGVVVSHGGDEGDVLEVGAVLIVIGEQRELAASQVDPGDATEADPIVGTLPAEAEVLTTERHEPARTAEAVQALPLVRKLARDNDIDLATIRGSGPAGRITREDLESAIAARGGAPSAAPQALAREIAEEPSEPESGEQDGARVDENGDERRPLPRLRRTIASNMTASWREIPHVTTFDDVDATRLLEVRAALSSRHDVKVPIEALVIKAVLPALETFPEFNATLHGDELIVHRDRHIGIAVDTRDGLLVAVVRDADTKSMLELAEDVLRLGSEARARSLGPDELRGQTFTVSNIGAVGGGHGTPIVPPGTTAILSVGMAKAKPVVYGDEIGIAPIMPLSLSYDHRVVDGALGRRFVSLVIENLEEPALFLAD